MADSDTTKSRAWMCGYHTGKCIVIKGVGGMTPDEVSDFYAGYHLGQRDKRNDAPMDEWEDQDVQ